MGRGLLCLVSAQLLNLSSSLSNDYGGNDDGGGHSLLGYRMGRGTLVLDMDAYRVQAAVHRIIIQVIPRQGRTFLHLRP